MALPFFFLSISQKPTVNWRYTPEDYRYSVDIVCVRSNYLKSQLIYYSVYFYYYIWDSQHFLILFICFTVLFQLTFTFIYNTFSKKISIDLKQSHSIITLIGISLPLYIFPLIVSSGWYAYLFFQLSSMENDRWATFSIIFRLKNFLNFTHRSQVKWKSMWVTVIPGPIRIGRGKALGQNAK